MIKSLQKELGSDYEVRYPAMPDEANAPYDLWKRKIEKEITLIRKPVVLVCHSIGASHVAKTLEDNKDFDCIRAGGCRYATCIIRIKIIYLYVLKFILWMSN